MRSGKSTVVAMAAMMLIAGVGCKKKAVPPPPPPPPAPAAEVKPAGKPAILEFSAEPSTVERGQSALLRWSVSNATQIQIDNGVGTVQANGSRKVIPSESTTYRLTAVGPAGDVSATATVNVTAPAPPASEAPKASAGTFEQRLQNELSDALFDYDKSDIRDDARSALTKDAESLKRILADFPKNSVVVEGHCDEHGSAEYNLGLGDRRASSAKDFLVLLGVPADKMKTISYGKERPQCNDASEDCYQRNRRAHIAAAQ